MRRNLLPRLAVVLAIVALLSAAHPTLLAQQERQLDNSKYFYRETQVLDDGTRLDMTVINGPPAPPAGFAPTIVDVSNLDPQATVILSVPTYDWSYGCTATSAAMIAAYYDRGDYPNMYTGPTDGGVMPMTNGVWGHTSWTRCDNGETQSVGECPLSATHNGIDGRSIRGHVDDYWEGYLCSGPDPWEVNGWTEHTQGDCTGDYMETNKWYSAYNRNVDGSTTLWYYTSGAPLPHDVLAGSGPPYSYDGGLGVKEFYESRGYTVEESYNQYILGYPGTTQGFTYEQYMDEIDAGHPVMIHLAGHTVVGVGYDDTTNLVYINDTWGYYTASMTWGGAYSGLDQIGVTVVELSEPTAVDLISFTAEPAPDGEAIALGWETASEIDNLGFNLYRAEALDAPRTRLNADLIPAQAPGSPAGGVYTWQDESVTSGITYYYWLEDVDLGGVATLHGPVTAELAPSLRLRPARPRLAPGLPGQVGR